MKNTLFLPFLWILITVFMTSCGAKGPLITTCSPRVTLLDFECKNASDNVSSYPPASFVDNFMFYTAADQGSILKACSNGYGFPKVKVCTFNADEMLFVCFNSIDGTADNLAFANAGDLIGSSPVDVQITIDFCSKLQTLKKKQAL